MRTGLYFRGVGVVVGVALSAADLGVGVRDAVSVVLLAGTGVALMVGVRVAMRFLLTVEVRVGVAGDSWFINF